MLVPVSPVRDFGLESPVSGGPGTHPLVVVGSIRLAEGLVFRVCAKSSECVLWALVGLLLVGVVLPGLSPSIIHVLVISVVVARFLPLSLWVTDGGWLNVTPSLYILTGGGTHVEVPPLGVLPLHAGGGGSTPVVTRIWDEVPPDNFHFVCSLTQSISSSRALVRGGNHVAVCFSHAFGSTFPPTICHLLCTGLGHLTTVTVPTCDLVWIPSFLFPCDGRGTRPTSPYLLVTSFGSHFLSFLCYR